MKIRVLQYCRTKSERFKPPFVGILVPDHSAHNILIDSVLSSIQNRVSWRESKRGINSDSNEQLSWYNNRFRSDLSPFRSDAFLEGRIGSALMVCAWRSDRSATPAGWAEWAGGWATIGRLGEERGAGRLGLSQDFGPWPK
jgi:hypothetical protein